jgi:ABC-type transporter Mla MlaB component
VRRSGRTDRAVGYGPRDHLCWIHTGEEAWRAAVVPYLFDGAVGRDRLLYVADKAEGALIDDLADLPGRDAMLASDQLRVRPLADAYAGAPEVLDAGRQLDRWHAEATEAVAAGYRGVRLAADPTPLVSTSDDALRLVGYELLVDAAVARSPFSSLCGYDRRRIGRRPARSLCFVHPVHHADDDDVTGALHADEGDRWCLSGELDVAVRDALDLALAALPTSQPVHLDVSLVRHIDVAGVRALAGLATRAAPAGGLVLHDPPDLLAWMLDAWGEVPGLQVVHRGR